MASWASKRPDHPFPLYRAAHVPVALSTDDEGVSRIDITQEYVRAALEYHLGYEDLKQLARTGMEHNFLSGESLWARPDAFTAVGAGLQGTADRARKSLRGIARSFSTATRRPPPSGSWSDDSANSKVNSEIQFAGVGRSPGSQEAIEALHPVCKCPPRKSQPILLANTS